MKFEIYKQSAGMMYGEWRWRLVSGNGEPIASGESYKNKADCEEAIDLIMGTNYLTPVYLVSNS